MNGDIGPRQMNGDMGTRRMTGIYISVFVISAAVLSYEVLLMRLFAIVHWHHFAYMAISIALLGFGASGTFLYLWRERLVDGFHRVFATNAAGFGVAALGGYLLAQQVPFNALAVFWQPWQLLYLGVLYLLLAVPFFAGANCIGLTLMVYGTRIGPVYSANLLGSGTGALAVIGLLYVSEPGPALTVIAATGIAAGAIALYSAGTRLWTIVLAAAAVVVGALLPASWTALEISPYKGLSRALAVKDAAVLGTRSSPLGHLSVVDSPAVPFRHAPGLSLNAPSDIPKQLAVFTDGDGMTAITAFDGESAGLAYLDFTSSALPYHLLGQPRVLVLGAGGGADVLQAIYHRSQSVDAVELNPQIAALVDGVHGGFSGRPYSLPGVQLHLAEARSFVTTRSDKWDVIQIPLLDSATAASAGVHSLSENHVYTVEAFRDYLEHLRPDGLLAVTRWLKLPPRDSLKLVATAKQALIENGVGEPHRRIALIRSWNTTTLLIKNGTLTPDEIADIRVFCEDRSFDVAYVPGMDPSTANLFNILPEPYFRDGANALLQGDDFAKRYKFDIRPATDDRPFFFDFFKWRSLPEFLSLPAQGGFHLLELGYPILTATLIQATLFGAALILIPLALGGDRVPLDQDSLAVVVYFACLGLAFLFVEIAFIQRFTQFLGHPVFAVAVVLAAFLIFAGVGSSASTAVAGRMARVSDPLILAATAIAILAAIYVIVLPPLFRELAPLPVSIKIPLSLALIAPLAFLMGLPFPLGLARLSAAKPRMVAWAWGVNGCFSVISAVLAVVLAIHFGFTTVVLVAVALYLAAGATMRNRFRQ